MLIALFPMVGDIITKRYKTDIKLKVVYLCDSSNTDVPVLFGAAGHFH